MLVQEIPILLLDGEVNTPEISVILGSSRLRRFINDPELRIMTVRAFHSSQVEQFESNRLEHPLLAAMLEVTLLDHCSEVQLAPSCLIFLSKIIPRFKIVPFVEIKLPHVF